MSLQQEDLREKSGDGDCENNDLLPLTTPPSTTTPSLTAAERRKIRQKACKKIRKKRKMQTRQPSDYKLRTTWIKKYGSPDVIRTQLNAEDLSAASNAWIGSREPVDESHPTLDKLKAEGYRYIEWNGRYVFKYCMQILH